MAKALVGGDGASAVVIGGLIVSKTSVRNRQKSMGFEEING